VHGGDDGEMAPGSPSVEFRKTPIWIIEREPAFEVEITTRYSRGRAVSLLMIINLTPIFLTDAIHLRHFMSFQVVQNLRCSSVPQTLRQQFRPMLLQLDVSPIRPDREDHDCKRYGGSRQYPPLVRHAQAGVVVVEECRAENS
jgi:hypothetical protein